MARPNLSEGPAGDGKDTASETTTRAKVQRLSITLTEDGKAIALDRMHAGNVSKLTELVSHPETARALGLATTGAAPRAVAGPSESDAALNALLAGKALELVGLAAMIGARRAGYTDKHAQLVMFRPEQREAATPVVLAVLNKYNLLGGAYAEEAALLMMVAGYGYDNWQRMREAAEKDGEAPATTPEPAPVSRG